MNETLIRCPNCGAEIPVSDVLHSQIRGELEKTLRHDHELRLQQAVSAAEIRAREQIGVELQGETLELDMQAELERQFPQDRVEPVPKGIRGADIVQGVRNGTGQECGTILWETKNTRNWQPLWLQKLKDDQRTLGAAVAVLVSTVLPEDVQGFGRLHGIWVADRKSCIALAMVLREQIVQVAFAHAAAEGKNDKMDMLYRYLAGDQFRQKVQGIVEAFSALQDQLGRERRAMEKQWREREKQIERVITNTVGMYGEMSGILGGTLPRIAALELDADDVLEGPPE